ncbi:MAG TPA: type III-B CRISPR module-associated protein Cmr5 [Bryobacteraceae bacterium]|nr:type III-B CRISPR module-associated protein Cmr5 [Bryobacteraceae bacterium]
MTTIDQKRAQEAWDRCKDYNKEAVNATKGLPALIMNSGLMQVLAFCHQKGDANETIARDLRRWLAGRFPEIFKGKSDFTPFMEALMNARPADYQAITTEALAWLKWLRQMASARKGG